jgi:hypothetical protein
MIGVMKYTRKGHEMYKVFPVPGGFQIFWCPSWPVHVGDKQPHSAKVYAYKQAAYYRAGILNGGKKKEKQQVPA